MTKATVISLEREFDKLRFYAERTPESTEEDLAGVFGELAAYRDGGIFIGHYAGNSQWERHSQGDEIVYVLEGMTRLFLLDDGEEIAHEMRAGEMLVVPQNIWHRFETPDGVKVLTATPQPTDHRKDKPQD